MNYEKLSLPLVSLIAEYELRGANMSAVHPPRPQAFSILPDRLLATIFIHCDENADLSAIPGVRVRSDNKTVRTAEVVFQKDAPGIQGLERLSERGDVHYLSSSLRLEPQNDLAALKTGLNNFRLNHPQLTGQDVVIGIIDSGIDSSHPAFANRLHSIWDQTIPPIDSNIKPYYGKILKGVEMAQSFDTSGHGTHLAGIAAGLDAQFGGVAPGATIVAVKTDFQTAHIADAIRYVYDVAAELNKPAVINLSAGGQLDSHDGTDDLSKFIERELRGGNGRIIVAAAGNKGAKQIHARLKIQPGQIGKTIFKVLLLEPSRRARQLILRGWYDSQGKCQIEIRNPGDIPANTVPPILTAGSVLSKINPTKRFPYSGDDEAFIVKSLVPSPLNNSFEFFFDTRRTLASKFVPTGDWRLEITNDGSLPLEVDVWSWVTEGANDVEFAEFINPSVKIGAPGCSPEAITVASYTSRSDEQSSFMIDSISEFSSPGPLRNGNLKPDVAAPGAIIISARSQHSTGLLPGAVSGGFTVGAGTSMAAAFITGVCALLLQNNPQLTPSEIKTWLRDNSRIPNQPANSHDEKWGFGLLSLNNQTDLP